MDSNRLFQYSTLLHMLPLRTNRLGILSPSINERRIDGDNLSLSIEVNDIGFAI